MAANLLSQFRYFDSLTVVGISVYTAIVCEAISWLLIYRTNSYKSLKSTIDKASKKLETMKPDPNVAPKISLKKSKTKQIDRVETSLKESSCDLSLFNFKSGVVVALVLFVVFGFLNNLYEGTTEAKFPFVPVRIVQKMSHRGLQGCRSDFFACSELSTRGDASNQLKYSTYREEPSNSPPP